MMTGILYDYIRSSSCYRVRIALALKGISYEKLSVSLLEQDNLKPEYKSINPQGLVPTWKDEHISLTQSLAIIEYLDETYPKTYPIIPKELKSKLKSKELAYLVACDMAPLLNNARIRSYLMGHGFNEQAFISWYHHWLREGFEAYETHLSDSKFSVGNTVTLADLCLIPQVINALRFEFDMQPYPKIWRIYQTCMDIPAFFETKP